MLGQLEPKSFHTVYTCFTHASHVKNLTYPHKHKWILFFFQMDSIFIIFSYWASQTWNANNSQTIPWNVLKNADSVSVDLRQS